MRILISPTQNVQYARSEFAFIDCIVMACKVEAKAKALPSPSRASRGKKPNKIRMAPRSDVGCLPFRGVYDSTQRPENRGHEATGAAR